MTEIKPQSGQPIPKPSKLKKPPSRIQRKVKPARVRKTERGREKATNCGLWSDAIRARDPICRLRFTCTGSKTTDAAHLFPKSTYGKIRFELSNGAGACRVCHKILDRGLLRSERKSFLLKFLGDDYGKLQLMALGDVPDRSEVRRTLLAAIKTHGGKQ